MSYLTTIRSAALRSLIPPPRLQLSEWIETNIKLPEGVSALPGAIRLYPYQREIADAISDPEIERVTMVKAARLGFTTLLTAYAEDISALIKAKHATFELHGTISN